jgi:DNA-binding CsgD family transcriptional regulator
MVLPNQEIRRLNVAADILSKSSADGVRLTQREGIILADIVWGLSSKEIARALDISPRTVEFHRANLLKKYRAKKITELVRKALGK